MAAYEAGSDVLLPAKTPNPGVQQFYRCAFERLLQPEGSLPPPEPSLLDRLRPRPADAAAAAAELEAYLTTLDLRHVEPGKGGGGKKRPAMFFAEELQKAAAAAAPAEVPSSGAKRQRTAAAVPQVGSGDPVADFNSALQAARSGDLDKADADAVRAAAFEQMAEMATALGTKGSAAHTDKAVKCLAALRAAAAVADAGPHAGAAERYVEQELVPRKGLPDYAAWIGAVLEATRDWPEAAALRGAPGAAAPAAAAQPQAGPAPTLSAEGDDMFDDLL